MKLILAIIQPAKLEAVKEALSKVEVFRMTIVDVQGFGRQKGHAEVYRGHELTVNLLRKVQLQIAVNEDFVEPTVNAIMEAGRTGRRAPLPRIGRGPDRVPQYPHPRVALSNGMKRSSAELSSGLFNDLRLKLDGGSDVSTSDRLGSSSEVQSG
jgi:nitrogen regulatory protein P-II 1